MIQGGSCLAQARPGWLALPADRPLPTMSCMTKLTTDPAASVPGTPNRTPSLHEPSAFVDAAGFVVDAVAADRVVGHIDLDRRHHTPWGIVHGGVYATAVESAASIGASVPSRIAARWRWDSPIPPTSSVR